MDCFTEVLATNTAEVLLHFLIYPNKSVFVWVSPTSSIQFDDFHVAVPDQFSNLPAVTSKLGENDSVGRHVALRLSKKLQVPVIVSWSLPEELGVDGGPIESKIFSAIQHRSHNPAVVGA